MQKIAIGLAILACTSAHAQTWKDNVSYEPYQLTFEGCQRIANGAIDCRVSYLTKKDDNLATLYSSDFVAVGPDGTPYEADKLRLGSEEFRELEPNTSLSFYADLPGKVTVRFEEFPDSLNSIPRLMIHGHPLSNVRLNGASTPTRTVGKTVFLGIPLSEAGNLQSISSASLTNCELASAQVDTALYQCTMR